MQYQISKNKYLIIKEVDTISSGMANGVFLLPDQENGIKEPTILIVRKLSKEQKIAILSHELTHYAQHQRSLQDEQLMYYEEMATTIQNHFPFKLFYELCQVIEKEGQLPV